MGYDVEENIGVDRCNLSEFFASLRGQLQLVTGLLPLSDGLTLEDVRRPNIVLGDPGIGKTIGIMSIVDELNEKLPADKKLGFKKILLGQTEVGSLTGIPVVNPSTGEVSRAQVPDLPVVERDGEYGVLFLDELTTADVDQVQPALGLCDDTRNIGTYQLPEHWVVVAAGNGPSCANFVELHDMTLSRFVAFDITYDYKQDWRPWAHAHGINELILAFLNFKPEYIVKVVTDEADKSGKQFPCPRTWTRLSTELKIRKAQGRPVGQGELQSFASRIIGVDAATSFAAFTLFSKQLKLNPQDILSGKVLTVSRSLKVEEFHIVLEQLAKELGSIIKNEKDADGNYTAESYTKVGNAMTWVISAKDVMLDNSIQGIKELRSEIPDIVEIIGDDENFPSFCPVWDDFIMEYADIILDATDDL